MLFQTMRAIFKPCRPNKHSDIPFSGKANRVEEVLTLMVCIRRDRMRI